MSYKLTQALKDALANPIKNPQFIVKIEGLDELFGALPVDITPRYDGPGLYYDMLGLYYDKVFPSEYSRDWIDLNNSTNVVTQQIEPDKGAGTSTSQMRFMLVDVGQRMSEIISPGFVLDEILGRKAAVHFTLKGDTAFPQDSIVLMYGIIEEVVGLPGAVMVSISHPQNLLRQDFVQPWTSKLTSNFEYKSATIGTLRILARRVDGALVRIRFVAGPSEGILVSGYDITVNIIAGVTTDDDVKDLIEDDIYSGPLVIVDVIGAGGAFPADTGGYINLGESSTMVVEDASGLIAQNSDPLFTTYIKNQDEVIKVSSINYGTNTLTLDITNRPRYNSAKPSASDIGETISSFYVIEGNCLDIALKLMLSGGPRVERETTYYGYVPGVGPIQNAIFFDALDIEEDASITVGDICTLTGVFIDRTISRIVVTTDYSYIVVSGADIGLSSGNFDISFKSKYDTLPVGCGLELFHVDVARFEELKDLFFSSIPNYRFFIDDSIKMKEFLESEIFFPSGMYLCPRKGRISCSIARPAIGSPDTVLLDETNTLEPENRSITRSLNQNFYNGINWYYEKDPIEDEFLEKYITVNADSVQRFGVGVRPLVIESKGFRDDLNALTFIDDINRRFLDRYKFAAEVTTVATTLGVGMPIEIGDTVIYGYANMNLPDSTQGNRSFQPRLWEVINKDLSPNRVSLVLLETKYGLDGRFGIISPSSIVGSGSTLTKIRIENSFGTDPLEFENEKWKDYLGLKLRIHTPDFSVTQECLLVDYNRADPGEITVSGLGIIPVAGSIVDIIEYPNNTLQNDQYFYKQIFCFVNPTVTIVSGISQTQFSVAPADIGLFVLGKPVQVHNDNYSIDSGDISNKVTDINTMTNVITINNPLGFVPAAGQLCELIGFLDGGQPYRLV